MVKVVKKTKKKTSSLSQKEEIITVSVCSTADLYRRHGSVWFSDLHLFPLGEQVKVQCLARGHLSRTTWPRDTQCLFVFSYTPSPPVYLKHTQTHIRVTQTNARKVKIRWGRVKALKSQVDVSFYQKRTKSTHSQTQIHTHSNRSQTSAPFKARCQVNLGCVNRRGRKAALRPKGNSSRNL